jgi:lipoprotein-anchoring transpeptidase ErfK/SrfK
MDGCDRVKPGRTTVRGHGARGATLAFTAVGLLATACTQGATRSAAPPAGPSGTASHHAPIRLVVTPPNATRDVRPGSVVRVVAGGATLRSVEVRSGAERVDGEYDARRHGWRTTARLHVAARYTVTATAGDSSGRVRTVRTWFRTLVPSRTFTAWISEQEGATYGVGMPIQLTFSRSIIDRAAVERALRITTSVPVVGAWYWLDDTHLDFRPRDYWPAYARVSVSGAFNGVRAAPGVFGDADVARSFRSGRSLIVVASTLTHRLRLYKDGGLVHDWPISTGRPGYDTPNGTYLTIDKGNPVEMRPAGIAPGEPGYYDLWVPWAVRFTWNGYYLHAASWSVAEQGRVNVSHGCVNMPPHAAEIYYRMAHPGDPVTVTGSPVAGDPGNGWTDWFRSWPQVLARSALHQAVRSGPDGSSLVSAREVPASGAIPPIGRPVANNAAAA